MFQHLYYSKEYYLDGKYVGSVKLDAPDRKTMGYMGRELETLQQPIIAKKTGKQVTLKAGTYKTELIQICGALKGTQKEKFEILKNSRKFYNN